MTAIEDLGPVVGTVAACSAIGIPRPTYYRWRRPRSVVAREGPVSCRALTVQERGEVLATLNSERFADLAPREVYATLLDEGRYVCSVRTMYRVLGENGEVRERRDQLRHPAYKKPELLATGPNQVWSWDITKLLGPAKWAYFYLYVILDIFSRYVVGWMVARGESAALAMRLIEETVAKQGIEPGQLTIHADRGTSMTSKPVAFLLADLGVTKTHSRPHVSDDNPYSESQFKTLKYMPEFPDRFGSIEDSRLFLQSFFRWYNTEHHHTGIGLLTPEVVHLGRGEEVIAKRREVLRAAYQARPDRFVRKVPEPPPAPVAAWINAPKQPIVEESNIQKSIQSEVLGVDGTQEVVL